MPAFKQQPQNPSGHPCALGTGLQMQQITATGAWQPVTLGFESTFISISCRANNTLTDYTHIDTPQELKFSATADGAIWDCGSGSSLPLAGRVGDIICYVQALAGNIITITGAV